MRRMDGGRGWMLLGRGMVLVAVAAGGETGDLFEDFREVLHVVEAHGFRDLGERHACRDDEVLGSFDAFVVDIGQGALAGELYE